MRAAAALLLHILSVHYIFVLLLVGFPALVIGLVYRKRPLFRRYFLSWLLYFIFFVALIGGIIFRIVNNWFLESYGMAGEAVIVSSMQQPGWFQQTPELRLVLKIAPDTGLPFVETISIDPSIADMDHLGVGDRVNVLYSPQYTHNITITSW